MCVCVSVSCLFVRSSLHSVRSGQLLCCAHKRIVNIMKVYIERKNMQVELIRLRKNLDFIQVYFRKATDSMQCRSPNTNQEASNTNHFDSVSDSLGRPAALSQCMASSIQYNKFLMRHIHVSEVLNIIIIKIKLHAARKYQSIFFTCMQL